MASEQDVVDGVLEAMTVNGAAVYQRDRLPDVLPPAYSEIDVVRRPGGNLRGGGPVTSFGLYDISERSTARNLENLRAHRDDVALIEGQSVTIGSQVSTPVGRDNADPVAPEDGWYVGFRTWTFALF